jgi:hypothetical protein
MKPNCKIFGIGLSRTGTSSLTSALRKLGYSAIHCPSSMESILHNDAATDTPIALTYKSLDFFFPGSKFILTDRKPEDWLISCEKFFSANPRKQGSFLYRVRNAVYGRMDFNAVALCQTRERHISDVSTYFASRPDDLLVLRICDGEGWEKLCPFLGKTCPTINFPHKNKINIT